MRAGARGCACASGGWGGERLLRGGPRASKRPPRAMPARSLVVLYGGEASEEVAKQLAAGAAAKCSCTAALMAMDEHKKCVEALEGAPGSTVALLVLETHENNAPAPQAERCVSQLLKARRCDYCSTRTSRPNPQCGTKCPYVSAFAGLKFAVVAIGDTNLLLDRQTTTAKDCNRVGQQMDGQLAKCGATRFVSRCECNEAEGLEEALEPWMDKLWSPLKEALAV